jgi:hypothetical protein
MTSTSATLLARLNTLRVANDMKPLKAPKSIASMEADIASLSPANDRTSDVAEYARSKGVDPKVARALLRRHLEKPATGWALTDEVRELIDASAERVAA